MCTVGQLQNDICMEKWNICRVGPKHTIRIHCYRTLSTDGFRISESVGFCRIWNPSHPYILQILSNNLLKTNNYDNGWLTFCLNKSFAMKLLHPYSCWATVTSASNSFEMFAISGCSRSNFALLFMEYTMSGNVKTVRSAAVVTASDAHHGRPVFVCTSSSADCIAPIGRQLGDKNCS